ncbi:MAG: YdcF family protein [Weeksellaceae bacterium]
MKKVLLLLAVLGLATVLLLVSLLLFIKNKAHEDTKVKSDVIMVLGGRVMSGMDCFGPICEQIKFVPKLRYNPCVLSRVDQAVLLYKEGYAPKILMSGGTDEDNYNEAEIMKKMAMEAGVPEQDILLETKSTSTYENFVLSRKVITDADLDSVIVVSEPYHMARAGLVASKLDYDYTLSPAINSTCWDKDNFLGNWNFVKGELLALIGYKILNKI